MRGQRHSIRKSPTVTPLINEATLDLISLTVNAEHNFLLHWETCAKTTAHFCFWAEESAFFLAKGNDEYYNQQGGAKQMPFLSKSLPFLLGRWFRQRLEKLFVRQPWLEAELAKHTVFRHQMSWGCVDQKPNAISEKSS